MRQRAMIAMALLQPELLIADEPTTALDVTIQAQILALIRKLRTDFGSAIVLITHDMGVVADVADRVVRHVCGADRRGRARRPTLFANAAASLHAGACSARSRASTGPSRAG